MAEEEAKATETTAEAPAEPEPAVKEVKERSLLQRRRKTGLLRRRQRRRRSRAQGRL